MARVKSYPVNLLPDPELPRGLFDPRWNDPRIAAKVAVEIYKRMRFSQSPFSAGPLLAPASIRRFARAKTETRAFALGSSTLIPGLGARVRGGAFNELHRRYTFGGGQPPVNFHAQAVAFGLDAEGRYFLRATAGRYDGGWGNEAALSAMFSSGGAEVGGVLWTRTMDPSGDVDVSVAGIDPALAGAFEEIDEVIVCFFAEHLGERGGGRAPREETEEDRVLDHALDVFGEKE